MDTVLCLREPLTGVQAAESQRKLLGGRCRGQLGPLDLPGPRRPEFRAERWLRKDSGLSVGSYQRLPLTKAPLGVSGELYLLFL